MISFLLLSLSNLNVINENFPFIYSSAALNKSSYEMVESGSPVWLVNIAWVLGIIIGIVLLVIGLLGTRQRDKK